MKIIYLEDLEIFAKSISKKIKELFVLKEDIEDYISQADTYDKEYINANFAPGGRLSFSTGGNNRGWHRIAKMYGTLATVQGGENYSCVLSIKRGYAYGRPEYHKVQLLSQYQASKIINICSISYEASHIITAVRHTVDKSSNTTYLEIYYNSDSPNLIVLTLMDNVHFELIQPELTSETVSNVDVLSELDLPANFDIDDLMPKTGGVFTGDVAFKKYLNIAAWEGYGTGIAKLWYNADTKTIDCEGGAENIGLNAKSANAVVSPLIPTTWLNAAKGGAVINTTAENKGTSLLPIVKANSKNGVFIEGALSGEYIIAYIDKSLIDNNTSGFTKYAKLLNEDGNSEFPGNVQAVKFTGPLDGNATSATKAAQDGNGNVIADTYIKKNEIATTTDEITETDINNIIAGTYSV